MKSGRSLQGADEESLGHVPFYTRIFVSIVLNV